MSELSNALNPHGIQTRSTHAYETYSPDALRPIISTPLQYVPHRSELELAMSEPLPDPSMVPQPAPSPPRPPIAVPPPNAQALQELLRLLVSNRQAQEIERDRRQAWEKEMEAKYEQRRAEMEQQLLDMRQEINALRRLVSRNSTAPAAGPPLLIATDSRPSAPAQPSVVQTPLSPVSQTSTQAPPAFIEGSSSTPLHTEPHSSTQTPINEQMVVDDPPRARVRAPAFVHEEGSALHVPGSNANARKRIGRPPRRRDPDESSDSDSDDAHGRPRKRTNHHDTRILTIQHAMRVHLLKMMDIETGTDLPDSHTEGAPLDADLPVRFVWEKTPKQSVHNGRMKTRVLADLKAQRRDYKHVPDKDFSKKSLDTVFDQAFTTLRQKYKAQRDEGIASAHKKKEELKALKSRRLARKKTKLANRSDSRNRVESFEHVTFDGALQLDCMSSEESGDDGDSGSNSANGTLRIRPFTWRSARLQRFYDALDYDDQLDKSLQPRRGAGRKERSVGSPKEYSFPPKGLSRWMVSRRWIREMQAENPGVFELLNDIAEDPPEFDWDQQGQLGPPSDDEGGGQDLQNGRGDVMNQQGHFYTPDNSASSLHFALANVS